MHVATVAADTIWKDPKANIEDAAKHVAEVLRRWPKTNIILFPEISLMGTVDDESTVDIAESLNGESVTAIRKIAQENSVAIVAGVIEENPNGKPFNTAFAVGKSGELLAAYHKNHLFPESSEFIVSSEPNLYTRGEELIVFELEGWKCGLSVCFDIRFPRLFEAYKKAGVELMLSPFNWVQGRNKPAIMEHLVKARAHENQFFFAAVDRTGSDPGTSYYGTSVISNPYCEDNSERDGIYAYAELNKDDIAALSKALPLTGSFKSEYKLKTV